MVRHAAMVNGLTALALTKLDVLSGMKTVRIAVAYEGMDDVPAGAAAMARVVPVYEEMPGWDEDLSACRTFSELPAACRAYVERLEELTGVPVVMLGVGPGRDALILRGGWFDNVGGGR
jgi:adenylosuccinate synthase